MHEIVKKLTVISVLIFVLVSGFASASFISIKNNPSNDPVNAETVTLYRCGPDGTITPINVNIAFQEGQNPDEAIAQKCSELVSTDIGMQNYFSGNNNMTNISMFARVTSFGAGTHLKSFFSIRIPFLFLLKYGLLQKLPLRYKLLGPRWIPLIVCNYSKDEGAKTSIETVPTPTRPDKTEITIEGKHTIWVSYFVGYVGWRGTSADFCDTRGLRTGFDGYASFIIYEKFS